MDTSSIILVAVLAILVIGQFVLSPKLDHKRIQENVEAHGGKVIEILRAWGSGSRYARAYEVSYMTAKGTRIKATCTTSMWNGVYWMSEHPPETASDESRTDVLAEEPKGPAQPVQCLDCGTMIPADQSRCPQCGWSYKSG